MQDSKLLVKLINTLSKVVDEIYWHTLQIVDKTNGIIHNGTLLIKLNNTLCQVLMIKLLTTGFAIKLISTSLFIQ